MIEKSLTVNNSPYSIGRIERNTEDDFVYIKCVELIAERSYGWIVSDKKLRYARIVRKYTDAIELLRWMQKLLDMKEKSRDT